LRSKYGFFESVGLNESILDSTGNPVNAYVHFIVPFSEGPEIDKDIQGALDEVVSAHINRFMISSAQTNKNIISLLSEPNSSMLKHLRKIHGYRA
jgi:hypothetical protein